MPWQVLEQGVKIQTIAFGVYAQSSYDEQKDL
jgi:hypothetical protein